LQTKIVASNSRDHDAQSSKGSQKRAESFVQTALEPGVGQQEYQNTLGIDVLRSCNGVLD
jgi:hypothetical protein